MQLDYIEGRGFYKVVMDHWNEFMGYYGIKTKGNRGIFYMTVLIDISKGHNYWGARGFRGLGIEPSRVPTGLYKRSMHGVIQKSCDKAIKDLKDAEIIYSEDDGKKTVLSEKFYLTEKGKELINRYKKMKIVPIHKLNVKMKTDTLFLGVEDEQYIFKIYADYDFDNIIDELKKENVSIHQLKTGHYTIEPTVQAVYLIYNLLPNGPLKVDVGKLRSRKNYEVIMD